MIGTLGDIVFEVSTEKIRTIDELKRDGSARFATHDVVGKKPVKEFIGPGLESISFSIRLSASLGINPLDEINKLRAIRDKGEAVDFILNGSPVSENLWVIDSLREAWSNIDNHGRLVGAMVDISLEEYPRDSDATATSVNGSFLASNTGGGAE